MAAVSLFYSLAHSMMLCTNYTRVLPNAQTLRSTIRVPDDNSYFQNGFFSVQIGVHNPFGQTPFDVEDTVNKDTQTAEGAKGFSLKPGTYSKYHLTAE